MKDEMKKYNTIVIDPPWNISMMGSRSLTRRKQAIKLPYKTMTIEEIKNFPLKEFAEEGCHIYLWTTNKFIRKAYEVFDAWGVNFHLMMVGVKPSGLAPNFGYVFGTEFVLLGIYGKPAKKWKSIGKLNWFKMFNGAGKHSVKPNEFYTLVESMSHPPYIDMFSRNKREGWDVWGNEVESDIMFEVKEKK